VKLNNENKEPTFAQYILLLLLPWGIRDLSFSAEPMIHGRVLPLRPVKYSKRGVYQWDDYDPQIFNYDSVVVIENLSESLLSLCLKKNKFCYFLLKHSKGKHVGVSESCVYLQRGSLQAKLILSDVLAIPAFLQGWYLWDTWLDSLPISTPKQYQLKEKKELSSQYEASLILRD